MITIALVIAVLYFAKNLLVPFALALLLSFLLAPPVTVLEKLHLGRIPSTLLVLALAFGICGYGVWLGMTELGDIAAKMPQYQYNLHRKIEAMNSMAGSALSETVNSIEQLSGELASVGPAAENATGSGTRGDRGPKPLPVEVVDHRSGLLSSLSSIGMSMAHLLEAGAVVLIFSLFMLIQRGDLRNRFIQLVGTGHLNLMTTALDDAARGISRYLRTQLIVNSMFGLSLGLGLFWIGVPNAAFWGALGVILRFIPYVGTLVAGFCPLLLAVAVFDGWAKPLMTFGLFAGIELSISAGVEPWLYGAHTEISSLAILVSTAFWTLLWGPVGLVLSTPMTVCLLVLGRYVPALEFLRVVLGEKIELPLAARYYQRLLAMDDDDAQRIAEDYLKDRTPCELFDVVLIPALSLAEEDRHQNALDEEREKFIYQTTKLLIEDVAEETAGTDHTTESPAGPNVVCMPSRDQADELIALMLEQVLRLDGYKLKTIALGSKGDMFQSVEEQRPDMLLISALPPFAVIHARSICRKARRRFPKMKIVLGLWGANDETEQSKSRTGLECFDSVITKLNQAETELGFKPEAMEQIVGSLASEE